MEIKYIVEKDNIQVKEYLKEKGLSKKLLKKIRLNNSIYVNDNLVKNYYVLSKDDILLIRLDENLNTEYDANDIAVEVLYEDSYILIAKKIANLAIQPSKRHPTDNFISSIKKYYIDNNIKSNIHIVTRLDYATSGIVLIAKEGYVHSLLSNVEYDKRYLCIAENEFSELDGEYNDPIRRIEDINIKRWVFADGKEAKTIYKVLKNGKNAIVEARLITGRTHQIRVHFAYHNHPLVGDKLYGNESDILYLHCYYLKFKHPVTMENIEIINYPEWYKE